jgi:protein disulfide-isomerase
MPLPRLLLLCALLSLGLASGAAAADPDSSGPVGSKWSTDYRAALATARSEKKLVLLDFTGSDWCVWCHRLHDEILSQKPFLDYADEQLVLVELDFPQNKPQSDELKRQNQTLAEKFGVTGYPTIILMNAEGHELGRSGYMQGGPKTFVRELKRLAAANAELPAP